MSTDNLVDEFTKYGCKIELWWFWFRVGWFVVWNMDAACWERDINTISWRIGSDACVIMWSSKNFKQADKDGCQNPPIPLNIVQE
jgi:hypothetical protein